jgi:hypothetical protein
MHLGGRGPVLVNHLADLVRSYTGKGGTTIRVYMQLASDSVSQPLSLTDPAV